MTSIKLATKQGCLLLTILICSSLLCFALIFFSPLYFVGDWDSTMSLAATPAAILPYFLLTLAVLLTVLVAISIP